MFKLNSKVEIKVLGYFLLNMDARTYINELAKILNLDPANLDKKLKELEKEGILKAAKQGKQKNYFLNKNYPLLKEVKKIFEVKYGLPVLFSKILKKLKGIKNAYIFGSYAKDQIQQESDIDLLLIGEHSALKARKLFSSLQDELQREINIIDLSPEEFRKKKKNKDDFVLNILSGHKIKVF